MKVKQLIKILELSSEILSHYKNKEVVSALTEILDMCKANSDKNANNELATVKNANNELATVKNASDELATVKNNIEVDKNGKYLFLNEVSSFTLDEIQERLNDKLHFPSVESLRNLAISVGISKQSRANKDNIIHSIIKVIERSRIDKTISERHD